MEHKKGIQLSQAFGAVLTLVLVAVLVIIAIFLFVTLGSTFAGTASVSVTNETIVILGTEIVQVNGAIVNSCEFADFAPGAVINTSDIGGVQSNTLILDTDYVIFADNASIGNLTFWNSTNMSYTYTWGSAACDATESMTSEFSNYTSLVGLVGTIIFLGLVIGILVAAFAFGGRREV